HLVQERANCVRSLAACQDIRWSDRACSDSSDHALNNRFANRYVREALRRYEKLTSMRPGIFVLGPHPESAPPCTCSNRPTYILSKQTARLSGLANRSTRRSAFSNSEIMRRDEASDIYSSIFVQCVHTRPMSLALIAA